MTNSGGNESLLQPREANYCSALEASCHVELLASTQLIPLHAEEFPHRYIGFYGFYGLTSILLSSLSPDPTIKAALNCALSPTTERRSVL